jgi:hypothetical protein
VGRNPHLLLCKGINGEIYIMKNIEVVLKEGHKND